MMSTHRHTLVISGLTLIALTACLITSTSADPLAPIEQWFEIAGLPAPRASAGIASYGNWLYVIGGRDGTTAGNPLANVWHAQISPDGMLSRWITDQPLPIPLYLHAVAIWNDHIYVIGGWDNHTYHREVWRADIQADGALGSWKQDREYPLPVTLHSAVAHAGRLYILGGVTPSGGQAMPLNKVYFADIASDGGLGPWQETTSLPYDLYRAAAVGTGGKLYLSGGFDGNTVRQELLIASIKNDGALGPWERWNMPVSREYHTAVIHDGRLVLLGGRNGAASDGLARVDVAVINGDGNVAAWSTAPSLPVPLYRHSAVAVRQNGSDTIYVLGGYSGNQARSAIYRSNVAPTPTPTHTPTPTPTPAPTPTATPDVANLHGILQQKLVSANQLQYDIVVENISGRVAFDVTILNDVPNGTTVIQVLDRGRWQAGPPARVTWQPGPLAPGATIRTRYVVQFAGTQANWADGSRKPDPGMNDSATALILNRGATITWWDGREGREIRTNPLLWTGSFNMRHLWLPMLER